MLRFFRRIRGESVRALRYPENNRGPAFRFKGVQNALPGQVFQKSQHLTGERPDTAVSVSKEAGGGRRAARISSSCSGPGEDREAPKWFAIGSTPFFTRSYYMINLPNITT